MTFRSILHDRSVRGEPPEAAAASPRGARPPDSFHDLRLGEILRDVMELAPIGWRGPGRDDRSTGEGAGARLRAELVRACHHPLPEVAAVSWRQAVFRDLDRATLRAAVETFIAGMEEVRRQEERARQAVYRQERERWLLASRERWCQVVVRFDADLAGSEPSSPAFQGLAAHLAAYRRSQRFLELERETGVVRDALAAVRYRLHVSGTRIRVSRIVADEPDYAADVLAAFDRFRQGTGRHLEFPLETTGEMSRVEVQVVRRVERLFPEEFAALTAYCRDQAGELDPVLLRFDREIQFYLAWRRQLERLAEAGLPWCLPELVAESEGAIEIRDGYDLALANRLIDRTSGSPMEAAVSPGSSPTGLVTNDLSLAGPERTVVISGPNQGGKTTFTRMVGQIAWLASTGCPVPASSARLPLVDDVRTHFEREEDVRELRSRLEDELVRIRSILEVAGPRSLILMNESFSSTALVDAISLGRDVLTRVAARGSRCVFVTFIHELAGEPGVTSMISQVDPADPSRRTFRIIRAPATGLAHAEAIAARHGLTYGRIREELGARGLPDGIGRDRPSGTTGPGTR